MTDFKGFYRDQIVIYKEAKMPRKSFLFFTLLLCSFCFYSCSRGGAADNSVSKPAAESQNENTAVSADNRFALNLYKELSGKDANSNIFFSPYSIYSAFGLLYEGAAGETARQLENIFGFNPVPAERRAAMNNELSAYQGLTDGYGIAIANSVWVNKSFKVFPEFSSALKNYYFAQSFNFIDAGKINSWVNEKTFGRIDRLVDSSVNNSQVILANAIYFKAKWASYFKEEFTAKADFFTAGGEKATVDMMHQENDFPYYENEKVQVLRMKYKIDNKNMSMTVILPKKNNISEAEDFLYGNGLERLSLNELKVLVSFPKFKLDWGSEELLDIIEKMGLANFSPDYSGISKEPLVISKVIHKAFIEVSEKETEAAAATVGMLKQIIEPAKVKPKIFKADHPFVYMITDDDNGKILFLGKMMNPAQSN